MAGKIDKITWGKIVSGNNEYHDIIAIDGNIEERDYPKLKELFGTSHEIGDWEIERLFSNNPDVVIIGVGWVGAVKVPDSLRSTAEKHNVVLNTLKSPKAVTKYNKLIKQDKKVNALIHSTC